MTWFAKDESLQACLDERSVPAAQAPTVRAGTITTVAETVMAPVLVRAGCRVVGRRDARHGALAYRSRRKAARQR